MSRPRAWRARHQRNADLLPAYNAPRRLHCPFCAINGQGFHTYQLTADQTRVVCPCCGEGRDATDADRQLYGGAA